jgi:hypothetical protein
LEIALVPATVHVAGGIGTGGLERSQTRVAIMTIATTTPIGTHDGRGGTGTTGTTLARVKATGVPLSTIVPAVGV